jgi:hypothetical protein
LAEFKEIILNKITKAIRFRLDQECLHEWFEQRNWYIA